MSCSLDDFDFNLGEGRHMPLVESYVSSFLSALRVVWQTVRFTQYKGGA